MMADAIPGKVAAIVVTRNRLRLLQENVAAVRSQTRAADEIIVVDNGSTDETGTWLAAQPGLTVIRQGNLGGAGGFHTGIKAAYERGHDWFWCMDDDTIPCQDTLGRLLDSKWAANESTGFLNSLVHWTDGENHPMNLPSVNCGTPLLLECMQCNSLPIENSSFVSMLVSRRAVEKCGLPLKEMFIWYDDVEYTRRMRRHFRGYLITDSIVVHATSTKHSPDTSELTEDNAVKYIHGLRNRMYLIMTSGGALRHRLKAVFREARMHHDLAKKRVSPQTVRRLDLAMLNGIFRFRPRIQFAEKDL